jgi:hypothetical protein
VANDRVSVSCTLKLTQYALATLKGIDVATFKAVMPAAVNIRHVKVTIKLQRLSMSNNAAVQPMILPQMSATLYERELNSSKIVATTSASPVCLLITPSYQAKCLQTINQGYVATFSHVTYDCCNLQEE